MANPKKITALAAILAADLDAGDVLLVDDVSLPASRKITVAELRSSMQEGVGLAADVRGFHASIVTASSASSSPGKSPTPILNGALFVLGMTPNVDDAARQFKIPYYYDSNPAFHIHWTKTTDANESGKAARWRVTYTVFDGDGGAVGTPQVAEVEDTYDDAGTTTRIVYKTTPVALVGITAGGYLSIVVESITPTGAALSADPGLFSLDITYDERINS